MLKYTKITKFKSKKNAMLDNCQQNKVLSILNNDGIILFPSDTTWMIGCDATNELAVEKIIHLKQYHNSDPLTIIVDGLNMLRNCVKHVHPKIETLLQYHFRPLTIVYEKGNPLANNISDNQGNIYARVILDPLCKDIIKQLEKPLVATTACVKNCPYPKNFGEISSEIIQGVDYVFNILQEGKNIGELSPIAKLDQNGELFFIRS